MSQTTGQQVLRNPHLATAIVRSLEEGHSINQIRQAHQVGPQTVKAVAAAVKADPAQIVRWNEERQRGIESIAQKQLRIYEDALDGKEVDSKVNVNQLPLHFGILVDKRAVLLEQSRSAISPSTGNEALDSTLDTLQALKAQVVNVQVNNYGTGTENVSGSSSEVSVSESGCTDSPTSTGGRGY